MDDKLKKIAVSQKVMQMMSDEMVKNLRQRENVQIVVVGDDLIHEYKTLQKQGIDAIILSADDKKQNISLRQEIEEKVFELSAPPELPEIKYCAPVLQKRPKPFVPRAIGRPCSHKKGGR